MRLLIGNDEPISLVNRADARAWTQRLLWFAADGDAVVLMDSPDPVFAEYVTGLTGVDLSTLRFHVLPSRWTGGNFDAWSLLDKEFQDTLLTDAAAATQVLALWPTPEVGWLVSSLEIEHKLPGAAFFREGGGILANSKVLFRALAAGSGVSVPLGGVCRSPEDAFRLSGHLLCQGRAFMVKRCYGGSGAGNEIVSSGSCSISHAGHASAETVEATPQSLRDYWDRRWCWASCDGTHAVVVEAFVPDARTLYVEVLCGDDGVGTGTIGELKFEDGRIAREVFPAQEVPGTILAQLQLAADRLAQAYRAAGYRGFLSLDSVVMPDGQVFFTEGNARFTSSTHLYDRIAGPVARIAEPPRRIVVQTTSPTSWQIRSLSELIGILSGNGLGFDPESRRGVLPVTPVIHGTGQLLLATVAENEAAAGDLLDSLHRAIVQSRASGRSS